MTNDKTDEVAGMVKRNARTLSDPQRLLWRDDVEGICPNPDMCFEYSQTARCGPCAIKQAEAAGVEPNLTLPNSPEVSRLTHENANLAAQIAAKDARIAELEGQGWQPIDTAPRDGTVVMFYAPVDDYQISRADDYWGKAWWLENATHWMPLPAPPALAGKGEG